MPREYSLRKEGDDRLDFELYRIVNPAGDVILSVYHGNNPSHFAPEGAQPTADGPSSGNVKCATWNDHASRECTFSSLNGGEFVHAFYMDLAVSRRVISDGVIASIEILPR